MSAYQEQQAEDAISYSNALIQRENERRERQQRDREAEAYASDLREYRNLVHEVRIARADVEEIRGKLQNAENSMNFNQAKLERLLDGGFIPPVEQGAPAPERTDHPVPPMKQEDPLPSSGFSRNFEPCPVCAQPTPPGLAWHRTDEGLDCVVDAQRTRLSGMNEVRIESALERQAQAKKNRGSK